MRNVSSETFCSLAGAGGAGWQRRDTFYYARQGRRVGAARAPATLQTQPVSASQQLSGGHPFGHFKLNFLGLIQDRIIFFL